MCQHKVKLAGWLAGWLQQQKQQRQQRQQQQQQQFNWAIENCCNAPSRG
jgi:hypothetical protein